MAIQPQPRVVNPTNKTGLPPHKDFRDVVGGWDFPVIILYQLSGNNYKEWKRFVLNNFDMNNILLNWLKETTEETIRDGNIKENILGYRLSCELIFHAYQQLDSTFDAFLLDIFKADKVAIIPHQDQSWYIFDVIIIGGWDYTYIFGKPYQGWEGVIKMKGIKRFSEPQMGLLIGRG